MADENYVLPETPEYDPTIRKIQNEDPVNAEESLNPVLLKMMTNIAAVKGIADGKQDPLSGTAGQVLGFDAEGRPQAQGTESLAGAPGVDGKSAYQAAVEAGYSGTETEFNNALVDVPNAATKDLSNVDNSVFLDKASSAGVGGIPIANATSNDGIKYIVSIPGVKFQRGEQIVIIPMKANISNGGTSIEVNEKTGKIKRGLSGSTGYDDIRAGTLQETIPITLTYNWGDWYVDLPFLTGGDFYWGVPSKRTARFTIGTFTAGWTADQVDYLCDGTDDQVEINAAITSLPSTGGEVVILDGIYNLTGSINVNKNKVTLTGNGQSTILKRRWDKETQNGVIGVSEPYCCVQNLHIDGDRSSYTSSSNHCIYINQAAYTHVIGNLLNNSSGYGIYINGGHNQNNSYKNEIIQNGIEHCNYQGICIYSSAGNTITNNKVIKCLKGIAMSDVEDSVVSSNIFGSNSGSGIELNSCMFILIAGNVSNDNLIGIQFYNRCSSNIVIGNACIRGTGTPSDYSSSNYTIYLHQTDSNSAYQNKNNLISCNNIMEKNYVDDGTSGSNNTFVNNKYN